ncbi:MAG: TMEM175 family protein, partial [Acidobacteriota bacterium]
TLLVLELKVPHLPEKAAGSALAAALVNQWPSYLALITSFFAILIMWANHHMMFGLIRRVSAPFLYANGLLLLVVTIVPFPTALLAHYFEKPGASVAAAVYGGTFVLGSVAYNLVWHTAIAGRRLLRSDVSEQRIEALTKSYRLGVPLYLVATVGAFVSVYITVGICTALWVFWIATSKRT